MVPRWVNKAWAALAPLGILNWPGWKWRKACGGSTSPTVALCIEPHRACQVETGKLWLDVRGP